MKKIVLIFLATYASVFNIHAQNEINGHEYVDLGLSVKWATCNVDANAPHQRGYFYSWGEISTSSCYSISNTKLYHKEVGDISGNPNFDVARAKWGSTWRMPTKPEMEELKNKCTWKWTSINYVNGYKIIGPNGNSIFLPAGGFWYCTSRYCLGERGRYWCSTPGVNGPNNRRQAGHLNFGSRDCAVGSSERQYGYLVRPVSD